MTGARVVFERGTLLVEGPSPLRGARLATCGDRRLAMAFSVASLVATGRSELDDDASVRCAYPGFLSALGQLVG